LRSGGVGAGTKLRKVGSPSRIFACLEFVVARSAKTRPPQGLGVQGQRRKVTERLIEELLVFPEEERLSRLREERFPDPHLFELLVEAGHEALPWDPRGAAELLNLATGLATVLDGQGALGPEIGAEQYSRALCLAGAARRLLGDYQKAEAAFERAACLPVSPASRGFFSRALGVLRWDQGRSEEAAALLHHAQRRYAEGQDVGEEAACLALLGMLHVDDGEPWRAARFLREASQGLDSRRRPWLAMQCCLGLAFCNACADEPEKAREARRSARTFGGPLWEEEELLSRWLEGRVAALCGDAEEAADLLTSVRRSQIAKGRLPEATFATMDLALLWTEVGKGAEIDELVEELRVAFSGQPGFKVAMEILAPVAEDAAAGRLDREMWSCVSQPLRMAFRWQGVSFRPLPIV
jgi:tetratricopeptide (TPR) repeat protein